MPVNKRGRLPTQRTLPYGTVQDVRTETQSLLDHGCGGGFIFSRSHSVESDVPLGNILAFLDV